MRWDAQRAGRPYVPLSVVSRPFWVARLHSSERTAQKISGKHGLRVCDVRDAVVCQTGLGARPHRHPQRGLRLYVDVVIDGWAVLVVVKPHEYQADEYYLVSAYRV